MNKELTYEELTQKPISLELPSVAEWKEVPIRRRWFRDEPLVALGPFSDYNQIFTDSIYYGEMNNSPYKENAPSGSFITMFVRKDVANKLLKAQNLLPETFHLVVFDAYRTTEVQGSLYDRYYGELQKQKPDWNDEQAMGETQKYVSLPSVDKSKPSPHNTGGAVDLAILKLPDEIDEQVQNLTNQLSKAGKNWQLAYKLEMKRIALIRRNAQLLEFGTPFDWGGKEAGLNYFERLSQVKPLRELEQEARGNRRFLYHVMMAVGMQPYTDEWWHYNSPKSQMGARSVDLSFATYGPIELSDKNLAHEKMRGDHRRGTIRLATTQSGKLGLVSSSKYLAAAYDAAQENGDPRLTSLPNAIIISPTS